MLAAVGGTVHGVVAVENAAHVQKGFNLRGDQAYSDERVIGDTVSEKTH